MMTTVAWCSRRSRMLTAAGQIAMPGHVGAAYQSTSARHVGRSRLLGRRMRPPPFRPWAKTVGTEPCNCWGQF